MVTEKEKNQMKKIFKVMDKDLNGGLDQQEVQEGLVKLGMPKEKAKYQAGSVVCLQIPF